MKKLCFALICFFALAITGNCSSAYGEPSLDWYASNGGSMVYEYAAHSSSVSLNSFSGYTADSYHTYFISGRFNPFTSSNMNADYSIQTAADVTNYLNLLKYGRLDFCVTSPQLTIDITSSNWIRTGRGSIIYTDQYCNFHVDNTSVDGYVGSFFFEINDMYKDYLETGNYTIVSMNIGVYTPVDVLFSPLSQSKFTSWNDYESYSTVYNENGINDNPLLDSLEELYTITGKQFDLTQDVVTIITDSSVNTSPFNDFFQNFTDSNPNGISAIVTSPVRFIRSFSSTCKPVTLTVFEKDVVLPCGDTIFWNRSDVTSFRGFWNILVGGSIVYLILSKVFKKIESMKDPDDNNVEVLEL